MEGVLPTSIEAGDVQSAHAETRVLSAVVWRWSMTSRQQAADVVGAQDAGERIAVVHSSGL
jgi:hypothetical protein